jgi:hypothetical protein
MALKRTLTKEEHDKLPADIKKEYKAEGDEFVLDLEGYEDPAAIRRARDREKQKRVEAEQKLTEAEEKLTEIEGGTNKKKGDIDKLEKAWEKKLSDETKKRDERISKLETTLKGGTVKNTATELARKISKVPAAMSRIIEDRLTVELDDDGVPELKVLDSKGKVSAMSLVDLEKEIVANKDFADIIIASKASGGGAPRSTTEKPGSAGDARTPTEQNSGTPVSLAKMSPQELADHIKARKAEAASGA